MRFNDLTDVLGGIVIVALVTAVVTSKNTAAQVTAIGNAGSNLLSAALGKGSAR